MTNEQLRAASMNVLATIIAKCDTHEIENISYLDFNPSCSDRSLANVFGTVHSHMLTDEHITTDRIVFEAWISNDESHAHLNTGAFRNFEA